LTFAGTGDNARHDIDRDLPRTPKEIYNLNRMVAKKMDDVFGSRGVKIVPSIGNNDIWRTFPSPFSD
jgi:endopolyphosphatase